jgi:hypothetical protein
VSQFNPTDHTVAEVNEHLATADADERERVLAAEAEGKNRSTVTAPADDETTEAEPEGKGLTVVESAVEDPHAETTTKAQTFQAAAEEATPHEGDGFLGFSPERERTGRSDKGLSQRNPAILTGGPIPDSRQGVDDSEGLAALDED